MLHPDDGPGSTAVRESALHGSSPPKVAPMKRAPLLAALALALSAATLQAEAQDHRRPGPAYRHHYPYHAHRWVAPYRTWRYYDPWWYWAAPAYFYPYPVYAPAPVIVGATLEPSPRYYEAPAEAPGP